MVINEVLFRGLFTPDGGIDGSLDPLSLWSDNKNS